jgi:hypothetical protein
LSLRENGVGNHRLQFEKVGNEAEDGCALHVVSKRVSQKRSGRFIARHFSPLGH